MRTTRLLAALAGAAAVLALAASPAAAIRSLSGQNPARFGEVQVGTQSPPKTWTYTITSESKRDVSFTQPSADFVLTEDCPAQFPTENGSCTIQVSFRPLSAGPKDSQAVLRYGPDPSDVMFMYLEGTGVGGGPEPPADPQNPGGGSAGGAGGTAKKKCRKAKKGAGSAASAAAKKRCGKKKGKKG